MPFGIPSEDFHGGFGIPHDEDCNEPIVTVKEEVYEDVIFGLNELLGGMADQGCMLDDELDRWCELMKKFREVKGFE